MAAGPDAGRGGADRTLRLLYLAAVLVLAVPTMGLLGGMGLLGLSFAATKAAAALAGSVDLDRGEALLLWATVVAVLAGFAALIAFVRFSLAFLRRGRAGLVGRRRALLATHVLALPALAYCLALVLQPSPGPVDPAFTAALSGLPILPLSLFLLWASTGRPA